MPSILALTEIVQELGSMSTRPPFTILSLGKALVSVSLFALVTLGVTTRALWHSYRGGTEERARARSMMDTGLFWGAFTLAVGVFHTLVGLMSTALAVRATAPIQTDAHWLIASGVTASLGSSALGLLVFLLVALVWLGFRTWQGKTAPLHT